MPPVKVTLPAALVTTPVAQVVDAAGVPARTNPVPGVVGKVSVTLVTVIALVFGLVMVTVKVEVPPAAIGLALKALLMVGADDTVKVAFAAAAFEPALLVSAPMAIVFA